MEGADTIGTDGATDNLAESKSDSIPHRPFSLVVQCLKAHFKPKTTTIVASNVEETVSKLNAKVGFGSVKQREGRQHVFHSCLFQIHMVIK